jgi:LemA protein
MFHKTSITASRAAAGRRGALGKGCLIGAGLVGALVVVALIVVAIVAGKYNTLQTQKTRIDQRWAEIDNQYKRRYDLIPNLVETVKGSANFEKSTLEAVTNARASVGRVQLPPNAPTEPGKLQEYMQAQQGLTGALQHLFAVAENYPTLKSSENFFALQHQVEGTENRIAVARDDYIGSVNDYNTSVRTFPGNIIAGMFNFAPVAQLQIEATERANPKIDFSEKK